VGSASDSISFKKAIDHQKLTDDGHMSDWNCCQTNRAGLGNAASVNPTDESGATLAEKREPSVMKAPSPKPRHQPPPFVMNSLR
jgi:hypothetical protein